MMCSDRDGYHAGQAGAESREYPDFEAHEAHEAHPASILTTWSVSTIAESSAAIPVQRSSVLRCAV
jgi:hypothetical protein